MARQLWAAVPDLLKNPKRRFRVDPGRAEADLRDGLGFDGPIEFVDHHLSHAGSAFFYSGFRESAVLTVDGVGEWATTTYGSGDERGVFLFEEVAFPSSLGLLYSAITAYLGFEVNDAEYKVMGLAPYGKPRYVDQILQLVQVSEGGQYALKLEFFDFVSGERMYSERLCQLLGQPARLPESALSSFHHDVAASVQVALEQILLQKVRYLHGKVPSENLCMAGGVALNCVANGRIHREGPFANLFVQPAASDAGGSLGAAAVAYSRRTGALPESRRLKEVLLGPKYSNDNVRRIVQATPLRDGAIDCSADPDRTLQLTAERLAAGKVVGWFQGRMEFGPRALGARSILADPRQPHMRDRINELVKMREQFRPFAPAVLAHRAADHFDLPYPSPFMLETCQVTSSLDLPAITHVDGSARVQTVDEAGNPRFHALIRQFEAVTGCPILLNTSFNLRGDAIALDPVDAIWCFAISSIDVLVLQDFVIDRGKRPDAWTQLVDMWGARTAKRRAAPDATNVYSFL